MKISKALFFTFQVLTWSAWSADVHNIGEDSTIAISVGNVYKLGRDQMMFETSVYDNHRVGGMIVRIRIDGDVAVEYNFYDRKKSQKDTPKDTVSIAGQTSAKRDIGALSGEMQKEIGELRKKSAALLLYEGQQEDADYNSRYSAVDITKQGSEIEEEPWRYFYTNALKLQKL
jgi:hypothetical protein